MKFDAAKLLRKWLQKPNWNAEPIIFSGVTDCYQPAEKQFRITRQCIEVCHEAHQPISLVTKNALITRDIDLLADMATKHLVSVAISITSLDQSLTRVMEPRTSCPKARLETIQQLSAAGIPVQAMVAPVIPGLNETEIASILKASAAAGANNASFVLLRLPWSVKDVFLEWLERTHPSKKQKVLSFVQDSRNGQLNSTNFGERMRGTGEMAKQIKQTFELFARKYGLRPEQPLQLNSDDFRTPQADSGQLRLF